MKGQSTGAPVVELDALLLGAQDIIEKALLEDTTAKYARAFRRTWVPLCAERGVDPLAASPGEVRELLALAADGRIRRQGRGPRRDGPISPGYLDVVIAAVRHVYLLAGRPCPFDEVPDLTGLLKAHAHEYGRRRRDAPPLAVMTPRHLLQLCTMGDESRSTAAFGVAAVLSFDAGATLRELQWLRSDDVKVSGADGPVEITFSSRRVTLTCEHREVSGVPMSCGACMVRNYLMLPSPGAGTGLLATRPQHTVGARLGASIRTHLQAAERQSPALTLEHDGGTRLTFATGASAMERDAARQLVTRAGTEHARGRMMTTLGLKLIAARGLIPADVFRRTSIEDLRDAQSTSAAQGFELRLPRTIRERGTGRDWFGIPPSPRREVCPVAALREWLMVREAAAGRPLAGTEPLVVGCNGWSAGTAHAIGDLAARTALARLVEAAGLTDCGYRWESVRAMHDTTVARQGANEGQLYQTMRLRKPEQMTRRLAALAPIGDAARRVAHGAGGQR